MVQYELRQQVIEPKRKTFQHLLDRYGDKPANRYQEGSIDVQATEHFHYRPLWDTSHEIYDEAYTTLRLADPYSFSDPRQFYYATYTAARAAHQDAFNRSLDYIGSKKLWEKLPAGWRTALGKAVVPLRHYESGAELICAGATRFAYGTTIEQCCSFAAFDRIANAQMLSKVGLAISGDSPEELAAAKRAWLERKELQGLRRLIEELLVERDWAVSLVGLDLADSLLYPLLYRELDEAAILAGAGAYSLLAQHFANWWDDHRRWLDELVKTWTGDAEHGDANAAILTEIVSRWLPVAEVALSSLLPLLEGTLSEQELRSALQRSVVGAQERLVRLGLSDLEVKR